MAADTRGDCWVIQVVWGRGLKAGLPSSKGVLLNPLATDPLPQKIRSREVQQPAELTHPGATVGFTCALSSLCDPQQLAFLNANSLTYKMGLTLPIPKRFLPNIGETDRQMYIENENFRSRNPQQTPPWEASRVEKPEL